jgi:hypothetical protein
MLLHTTVAVSIFKHVSKQMAQYMEEQRLKVEAIAASVREDCMAHLAAQENASTVVM